MVDKESILIKEATSQDAADIASTHIASWRTAYQGIVTDKFLEGLDLSLRTQSWEKILTESELPCLILKGEKKLIGFVHLSRSRDTDRNPEEVAEITSIYLDPRYYRQGYGTVLMAHAMSILMNHRFSRIDLWVLEKNLPARRFYEKLGFSEDGTSKMLKNLGQREIRYTKLIYDLHRLT